MKSQVGHRCWPRRTDQHGINGFKDHKSWLRHLKSVNLTFNKIALLNSVRQSSTHDLSACPFQINQMRSSPADTRIDRNSLSEQGGSEVRFKIRHLMLVVAIFAVAMATIQTGHSLTSNVAPWLLGFLGLRSNTMAWFTIEKFSTLSSWPTFRLQNTASSRSQSGPRVWRSVGQQVGAHWRSDWFVVERDGVRNSLHLASAHDGLAMAVWINEGVTYNQRNDGT